MSLTKFLCRNGESGREVCAATCCPGTVNIPISLLGDRLSEVSVHSKGIRRAEKQCEVSQFPSFLTSKAQPVHYFPRTAAAETGSIRSKTTTSLCYLKTLGCMTALPC